MNIMVKDEEEITSKRMKYSGGAFSKDSKSGSVKKLIILANAKTYQKTMRT